MQAKANELLEAKKYNEYLKMITEIYKKEETQENALLLKKAQKMVDSYKEYLDFTRRNPKTHYEVLNVNENASIKEIKSNYKKLVLKFHPDRSGISETNEIFLKIQNAYSILSDERSKAEYDNNIHNRGYNNVFNRDYTNIFNRRNYESEVFYNNDYNFVFDERFIWNIYNSNRRRNVNRENENREVERTKAFIILLLLFIIFILTNIF